MSKEELLEKLKSLEKGRHPEGAHVEADNALVDYINDPEIRQAFDRLEKWYA